MKLNDIKPIAERVKFLLQPYCLKCEIAGSIRRQKEGKWTSHIKIFNRSRIYAKVKGEKWQKL